MTLRVKRRSRQASPDRLQSQVGGNWPRPTGVAAGILPAEEVAVALCPGRRCGGRRLAGRGNHHADLPRETIADDAA